MEDEKLREDIRALLAAMSLGASGFKIEPCIDGGNNRAYRVEADGRVLLAKRYFMHPADTRDRLNAEFSFLDYARKVSIDCVPSPFVKANETGIALYDYLEGRKIAQNELHASHIDQARDFFLALNDPIKRTQAAALANASEACFSIGDQLKLIQQRVDRLSDICAVSEINARAIVFASRMRQHWTELRTRTLAECHSQGLDPAETLASADRCISPSDFGFHNALLTPRGRVSFIDFEYAGWDDPAKMICDFFSQPAVPVPFEYFESLLSSILPIVPGARAFAARTRILLPVFRMKWCCIVMNDFLPDTLRRRKFADPTLDDAARKQAQLDKAQRLLHLSKF